MYPLYKMATLNQAQKHYKMSPLQEQILCEIGRGTNLSKSSIKKQLKKHYPDVHDAVKILLDKNLIRQKGEQQRRGNPEKFYILTEKGIQKLIDLKIPLDDFWRMLFFVFDKNNNHDLKKFTIDKLFSLYEKEVMLFSKEFSPPIYDLVMSKMSLLKTKRKIIYNEILAALKKKKSISTVLPLQKNSQIIFDMESNLLIHKCGFNLDKYCLSHFGLVFLLSEIYEKTKPDTSHINSQIKLELNLVINNSKNLFPKIFKSWETIRKILNEKEVLKIFNDLVNYEFDNPLITPLQNNGIQEIANILKSMRIVYKNKIKQELDAGIKIQIEWFERQNNKNSDVETGLLINYTMDPNGLSLPQNSLGLQGKIGMLDFEDIHYNLAQRVDGVRLFISDLYRQKNVQNRVEDLISFLFYTILIHNVKNKLCYLKSQMLDTKSHNEILIEIEKIIQSWDNLLKSLTKLKNWYSKWIFEILKFQKQNSVLIENLSEFSINR